MPKRTQEDAGEERVTAKSKPMMNLIARTPSHVSSSTSVSPGKRGYGSQDPWSSIVKKEEGKGRPDKGTDLFEASDHHYHDQFMESFSSASYSKWDDDRACSSQEWKTEIKTYERSGRPDKTSWKMIRKVRPGHEEILLDGTAQSVRNEETPVRPDINSQEEVRPQQFVIGNDETELELSAEPRSFVNRMNDQVRKRQKIISNVTENEEKHSMIWRMFVYGCNNGISGIHGKESPKQLSLLRIRQISHLNKCSTHLQKLVSEQDDISGLETIGWENHSWKYLSLIGDERIINLQRTKVHVFSDSVLCLGKILQNPESDDTWDQRLGWIKSSQNYRNFDRIDGDRRNSSGIFSQDSIRCSSVTK